MVRGFDASKLELWQRRLREFEVGSLSVVEFCRRTGISKATFYVWRRKLAGLAQSLPESNSRATGKSVLSFLPVQITGQSSSTIEVLLTNGTRVFVASDDREAVRTVLHSAAEILTEGRTC